MHLGSNLSTRTGLAAFAALAAALAAPPASAAPSLDRTWGTYFGTPGIEFTNDLALDAAGNLYIVGSSTGPGLATPGAHQSDFAGQYDAYLAKFDPTGALVWATYVGGPDQDLGFGVAVGGDTVAVIGVSRSTSGIATPGALQTTLGGGDDGFVVAFGLDGARKWGTYIGTADMFEEAYGAAIDAQGSVYAVGYVTGAVPGLGTAGTHQPNIGASTSGYLVKFASQGQVEWGTYYGAASSTVFQSVSLNALGELYVSGVAFDPSQTIASPDAHQTEYGGGLEDAVLVRFDLDGTRVWSTFYGGEAQDRTTSVAALPHGGVVLSGLTLSDANIVTPDAHQTESDGMDAFVARFDAAGTRAWGTYYGFPWTQTVGKVAVDAGGSIYLTGQTNWNAGYGTPNGYQPEAQGEDDAYFAKLSGEGVLQWGSFYGGAGYDGAGKVAVDAQYRVHLLGGTQSTSGIATPGAYDETYQGNDYDSFLVQFTQPIGLACAGPEDCGGGGPCVDGVCCDSTCGGGVDDCLVCSAALGAAADGVCTPLAVDVVCRPSAGTCDAAEFCPGDAGTCPEDAPASDGEPCDAGVCEAGACVPVEDTTTGEPNDTTTGEPNDTTTGEPNDTTTGEPNDPTGPTTDEPTTGTTSEPGGESTQSSGEPDDDSTGEAASATAGEAQDGGGCGCRSDGNGGLLVAAPLLLLLRRRRAARRGSIPLAGLRVVRTRRAS
ncbi:SBBP repeat-containing protein [Nannocystis radixulma]|uniref:SBBP repeat-containing protein n=1 Tax=Nannocystis radixulma TaxID=2995305 RepID=A0ABT5BG58_9BACT|nr:SBBP repeat-containing protein [Nannocystis radixulma]MDC0671961.1 SBBP repeat-containing protein [Nannocystis radixulma]